jgi:hypothetical protein
MLIMITYVKHSHFAKAAGNQCIRVQFFDCRLKFSYCSDSKSDTEVFIFILNLYHSLHPFCIAYHQFSSIEVLTITMV